MLPSAPSPSPSPSPLPAASPPDGPSAAVTSWAAPSVALLCLGVVLLDAAADLLPGAALVWVVTPLRLVAGIGLVAALVAVRGRVRTALDVPVLGLLLGAAVATVAAAQDWSGWRGVATGVVVLVLAVGVRRTTLGTPGVLGLLALVGVALAGVPAVGQALSGADTGFCRGGATDVCGPDTVVRVIGSFPNPNLLAAFLVLMLPLALAGAARSSDRGARLVGFGLVVLGCVAVLGTVSRGGWLAALTGAGAAVVLRKPTDRRIAAAAVVPVALAGVFVLASGGSVGVREDVWDAALQLVVAHPLGVGPGRAGPLIAAAVSGDEQFQHAHNMWLNWAVETGLPGLAAAVALTAVAALLCLRAARWSDPLALPLGAGLAGFAVIGLADHPANATRISVVLWIVLGLLAGTGDHRGAARRPMLPEPSGAGRGPR